MFLLLPRMKYFLFALSTLVIFHLLFLLRHPLTPLLHAPPPPPSPPPPPPSIPLIEPPPTTSSHLLFSIASSSSSLPRRIPYIRHWYSPNSTPHAYLFLDRLPLLPSISLVHLPPIIISSDTSQFPYTFPRGNPSAVRVARIVKDVFTLLNPPPQIRWFVFGDDDTVFFIHNLAILLSKYDYTKWFYVGFGSEDFEQNEKHSFGMAYGGGGFALSAPLAKILAGVLDSCLYRYPHLYGSDARIFACLAELGVELTREPGFHQIDLRGDLFGLLVSHPLSPFASLHHLEAVEPIFPGMSRIQSLEHLSKASYFDSPRIFQQTVCYNHDPLFTLSVSWGYAVQIYERIELLPHLLSVQRTFRSWRRRGKKIDSSHFMFNTREMPIDPCKRPLVFFFHASDSNSSSVWTDYVEHNVEHCIKSGALQNLERIRVFSKPFVNDKEQIQVPRRSCCDIRLPTNNVINVDIRNCLIDETISFHG